MMAGETLRSFLCTSCYKERVHVQREYDLANMATDDLNDLEAAIDMSMRSSRPQVVSRTTLGRFPVSAADRAQSRTTASSSTQPPVDNQQEAFLQGMEGTPEDHVAALRMAMTQMLQDSTPERVAEIAHIFRPGSDPRITALARVGYPEPEMPLNAPLPYQEGERTGRFSRPDRIYAEIYGGHISDAD